MSKAEHVSGGNIPHDVIRREGEPMGPQDPNRLISYALGFQESVINSGHKVSVDTHPIMDDKGTVLGRTTNMVVDLDGRGFVRVATSENVEGAEQAYRSMHLRIDETDRPSRWGLAQEGIHPTVQSTNAQGYSEKPHTKQAVQAADELFAHAANLISR
jgi:hypothetical protein